MQTLRVREAQKRAPSAVLGKVEPLFPLKQKDWLYGQDEPLGKTLLFLSRNALQSLQVPASHGDP